jgi:hypothetical protein
MKNRQKTAKNRYPSVTEVLSPWTDFSMVSDQNLRFATQRGIEVHQYCAAYAKGIWVMDVPDYCDSYFTSFKKWFDMMVGEVLSVENEYIHPGFFYIGHPDLICKLKDETTVLIDLKTPITKSKIWQVQLAAYAHLLIGYDIFPDKYGSLQLSPEGKIAKMNWYENNAEDFNIFLSALNCWKYFK